MQKNTKNVLKTLLVSTITAVAGYMVSNYIKTKERENVRLRKDLKDTIHENTDNMQTNDMIIDALESENIRLKKEVKETKKEIEQLKTDLAKNKIKDNIKTTYSEMAKKEKTDLIQNLDEPDDIGKEK